MTHPLLEELHGIPPSRQAEQCKIGLYLKIADGVDADAVQQLLNSKVTHEAGAALLGKVMKLHVGSTLVGKHRRKVCVCYRAEGE